MRSPFWLVLGVLLALPVTARAQKINAKGAAAAGVCAGALDLAAGMKAQAGNTPPAELVNMQRARDFFAELPMYQKPEITANAEAFVKLMSDRMTRATNDAQRAAITSEIGKIAKGCFDSASKYARPANVPQAPTQPGTVQPETAQPLQQAPAQTVPLETQPLTVNPQ